MAANKPTAQSRIPKVRIVRPSGRPFQIRYRDPDTKKETRISVGCRDEYTAEQMKADVEAKLRLGMDAAPKAKRCGPQMPWSEFRHEHTQLRLSTLRPDTASDNDYRLDVVERIINPRTLADMADPANLERLKAELLAGAGNGNKRTGERSAHTVNGYLRILVAALNWAYKQRWLPEPTHKQVVPADEPDRGRPLCLEEFERMIAVTTVVCDEHADEWCYLLYGLWDSGLRLAEAMSLSFDLPDTIQVVRERRGTVLKIPGRRQKNRKHQIVPTTAAFVTLVDHHPTQSGYVFDPPKLNGRTGRMTVKQVSRVITSIGEKANVIVNDEGKAASAHDLRRSFGQRLADAGVAPRDLQKIMRHRTLATTEQYYLRDDAIDIASRVDAKLYPLSNGYTSATQQSRQGRQIGAKPLKNNVAEKGLEPLHRLPDTGF